MTGKERDRSVQVLLHESERKDLRARAKKRGLSASAYSRMILLEELARVDVPGENPVTVSKRELILKLNEIATLAADMCGAYGADAEAMRFNVGATKRLLARAIRAGVKPP